MLFVPLVLLGLAAGAAQADPQPIRRPPVIRIALETRAPAVEIGCAGAVRVWRRGTGLRGTRFAPHSRFRLVAARGAPDPAPAAAFVDLRLADRGSLGHFEEELLFEPLDARQPLELDGRPYRGEIYVRAARGRLTVINAVRIEDYLCGVVPLEMGSGATVPDAALRAQAVAARSYALYYLGRREASHGCDLLAGTQDQVYGGVAAETVRTTRAVHATQGIVAVYEGRPIRANYSSTCGGQTEAAEHVWHKEHFPYLRPVRDREAGGRPYCEASPHSRWKERWSCAAFAASVLQRLPEEAPAARGRALGRLRDLEVRRRSPSGRVEVLEVVTTTGRFRVEGDRIRWLLRRPDGRPLRSTLFARPSRHAAGGECWITLEGIGYGHGVGLCQYGARELARQGATAPQILRHYYRGIEFARWW